MPTDKNDRSVRFQLLREMFVQGLLKSLEIRSVPPFREFPSEGFMEAETFFGRRMKVLASECVSRHVAARGYFEPGLCAMLMMCLKPDMVFFDIGAHYGFHSLLASLLVGRRGAVHAFEPTKATWGILHENVRKTGNIQVHNFAFWSSPGARIFRDFGADYSAFNSFFDPRRPLKVKDDLPGNAVIVETQTVDGFVKAHDVRPDFIKIDAESAEMEILKGMDRTIAKFRPILTLEVGDENIPGVCLTRDLIQSLSKKDYRPFELRDGKLLEHVVRDHYVYDNLLFLPADLRAVHV